MECQPKIRWTLYLTMATLFIFISLVEIGPFSSLVHKTVFSHHLEESAPKHVIVFDGGSTGTRMHVFSFVNNASGLLTLENEYFEEVRPGLSNFANKPKKAAKSVANLLEKAKGIIPSCSWDVTPVTLKATAGLRLLPTHVSDSILEEVSKTLTKSPFLSSEDSVSILDGEDEGLYAWHTLNFLLGRLGEPNRSIAMLDLGGGSTQVTFLPVEFDTLVFSPKEYIINNKIQNRSLTIYSHSYLGLGLMSARKSIMELSEKTADSSSSNHSSTFTTPCLPPGIKADWELDQKQYTVYGSENEKYGYKSCYDKAVIFLGDAVDQPDELLKREIVALSYYYDRAVELGIVSENAETSTVGEFIDACKLACSKKQLSEWYICLDCSYISALFSHGLAFNRKKEIMFVKRIDGVATSWALGAAFSLLQ